MIQVLDHGYIKLIETWGSDERIVEAARMSTGKGFLGWGGDRCPGCDQVGRLDSAGLFNRHSDYEDALDCECKGTGKTIGDEKLLRYLWEHKHATPFEMAGLVVEVQAPILVFREWHRHRTQSYNEMSARYMPLPDVNYIPTVDRLLIGGGHLTKQAGTIAGAQALTTTNAHWFRVELERAYADIQRLYEQALQLGIPKELARAPLPVGRYSRMRASANLRNWLAFLTLRMDKTAQWEIRQYANAVGTLIGEAFPRTWELFESGRR
jgi:thymidylate synthase (FAD)